MLDTSHLPVPGSANIKVFYGSNPVTSWVTWQKPRGISFIYIYAIGGGGGGGGGTTTTGGVGGASSAKSSQLFCANDLPDTLYISVGVGGLGAAAGGAPTSGTSSIVGIAPSVVGNNLLLVSSPGAGASAGTSTLISGACLAGLGFATPGQSTTTINIPGVAYAIPVLQANTVTGASGTGTTATITYATTTVSMYSVGQQITVSNINPAGYNGTYTVTACSVTSVSYANTTTAAWVSGGTVQGQKAYVTINNTYLGLTAGGSGGDVSVIAASPGFAGVDVNNPLINTAYNTYFGPYTCLGGLGGATATSNGLDGSNGMQLGTALSFFGGAGGGSSGSTSGTGGNGGSGAYGCGGGGGGAGVTSGGTGGKGGDGLVIVAAW